MKDAEHGPTAWAWSPHAASFAAPPSYSACTAASRTVWPALHAKHSFQSEQLLKQDLFVGKHARPQRSAWTDFALHAHCGRAAAPASKETALAACSGDDVVAIEQLTVPRLRDLLANRTLLLLGDSVMGQLMGFLSCWLLSEATANGLDHVAGPQAAGSGDYSLQAAVASQSAAWLQRWDEALLDRAKARGSSPSHPIVARAQSRNAWPLHTRGTAVVFKSQYPPYSSQAPTQCAMHTTGSLRGRIDGQSTSCPLCASCHALIWRTLRVLCDCAFAGHAWRRTDTRHAEREPFPATRSALG